MKFDTYAEVARDPKALATYWHGQINRAKKLREKWMSDCEHARKVYTGEVETDFNVLYSNIETRAAARYNSTPTPDVRPAHGDFDQAAAKRAAALIERALAQQLDAYDFDGPIESAVYADELYGQAQARVFWETDSYVEIDEGVPTGEPVREYAKIRYVPHGYYLEGPATSWDEVPWVAFKVYLTREDLIGIGIDRAIIDDLAFDHRIAEDNDKKAPDEDDGGIGYECCWQIFDKGQRAQLLLSEDYSEAVLNVDPDPVPRLPGFFPCPEPLQLIRVPGSRIPVCPYSIYRKEAEQLSEVSRRIRKLTRQLKYRGLHASELTDLVRVQDLDDGEFAPSSSAMSILAQSGSLDNAIWAVPIDMLIKTLRELIAARDELKQSIYEVTGLSDVLRGASDPSETATAQGIKAEFGGLRISRTQRSVQRFARDLLRLKAEIISSHFADETLFAIDGPQSEQEMQEHQQAVAFIRSDDARYYRIDIETDSTVAGDIAKRQQNVAGFITGLSTYAQTFAPLVQQFGMPAEPVLKLAQAFSANFRLGKQAERAFDELIESVTDAQRQNPPEQQQAKRQEAEEIQRQGAIASLQKTQAEAEKAQAEAAGQQVETAMQATYGPIERMGGFVG